MSDETLAEIYEILQDEEALAQLSEQERWKLEKQLCAIACEVALCLDRLHGIEPGMYDVTPDKRSFTYRIREALEYTYS